MYCTSRQVRVLDMRQLASGLGQRVVRRNETSWPCHFHLPVSELSILNLHFLRGWIVNLNFLGLLIVNLQLL